jgi:O-succinylbenzoate synthase
VKFFTRLSNACPVNGRGTVTLRSRSTIHALPAQDKRVLLWIFWFRAICKVLKRPSTSVGPMHHRSFLARVNVYRACLCIGDQNIRISRGAVGHQKPMINILKLNMHDANSGGMAVDVLLSSLIDSPVALNKYTIPPMMMLSVRT